MKPNTSISNVEGRSIDRRTFMRTGALAAAGLAVAPSVLASPDILTSRRTRLRTQQGTLAFRPHFVQRGVGPHINWAYASDANWDAFRSDIEASSEGGVVISDAAGQERFGINTRWNVEGFGYIFLTADNGGDLYQLPPAGRAHSIRWTRTGSWSSSPSSSTTPPSPTTSSGARRPCRTSSRRWGPPVRHARRAVRAAPSSGGHGPGAAPVLHPTTVTPDWLRGSPTRPPPLRRAAHPRGRRALRRRDVRVGDRERAARLGQRGGALPGPDHRAHEARLRRGAGHRPERPPPHQQLLPVRRVRPAPEVGRARREVPPAHPLAVHARPHDAGVDFTITGQQMYFPYRDLQDTIMLVERMAEFGRPVQLTEVGATSGPSRRRSVDGSVDFPTEPYVWRRPWDEEAPGRLDGGIYTLPTRSPGSRRPTGTTSWTGRRGSATAGSSARGRERRRPSGTYAYASDTLWDTFHSNIEATPELGIRISDTGGRDRFGVNVRWNVEGFGYLFLTADNAGEFYELPARRSRARAESQL
jgi:hypothetical protein